MKTHEIKDHLRNETSSVSIKTESETSKKLLMLSLIDGNEDDVQALILKLMEGGVYDQYQVVVSRQPIQAVDPIELIEQLSYIYNVKEDGDPNNTGLTRTDMFRQFYRQVAHNTEAMARMMLMLSDRIGKNSLDASLRNQMDVINVGIESLKKIGPREGVKM